MTTNAGHAAADTLEERLARNETIYRNVNEGIRAGHSHQDGRALVGFLCECGELGCNVLINMTATEYESVRAHARRFALVPGHQVPQVERVVARSERFIVVEKLPATASIAERSDPRAR